MEGSSRVTLTAIANEAKQSMPAKKKPDCFVAEFIIGPAEGPTRWLLAMTASIYSLNETARTPT
jgi:hypothetical protein